MSRIEASDTHSRRYNAGMRAPLLGAVFSLLFALHAFPYPGPVPGTENVPKLMTDSTLVCKGEVVEAPEARVSSDPQPPHRTATAVVHVDRCFKGERPSGETVFVLFDNILPPSAGPYVVLRKGDYRLFFLKPEETKYALVDDWFGQLSISRQLGTPALGDPDPMHQLEVDLKAGLTDSDRDLVLDSIRMLGNMRHLQSKAELIARLDSPDPLVRTYVFEAMLRLHDYSVLPAVEQWLMVQPQPPAYLIMPRDALFEMQGRLVGEISLIRDPATLPILFRLLQIPSPFARRATLQAVRAINSPQSAPSLLKMLDDPNADNAFIAMQALIELAGGGPIDWVPSLLEFRENPRFYAARCREWWQAEHQPQG
jgi:HEAT repeat protein